MSVLVEPVALPQAAPNSVLDWKPKILDGAYYKEVEYAPIQQPTISLTGNTFAEFLVNSDMDYLLSRAHLDGAFTIPARAALKHNVHLGKHMMLSQIQITSTGGQTLLTLTQPVQVSQSMYLPNTKMDDFQTRNISQQGLAANTGLMRGEIIHPSQTEAAMSQAAGGGQAANVGSTYADSAEPGGYSIFPSAAGTSATPGVPSSNGLAPATAIGTVGQNAVLYYKFKLNLSDFKHTLLAIDRNIYGNRQLNIKFTFSPGAYWGYDITGAATPSLAGSADLLDVPVLDASSLKLYIPVQQNRRITDMMRMLVESDGFRMLVPETVCGYTSAITATGNAQITVQIPPNAGRRLLRCYVVANNPNAGSVRYSNTNWYNVCADGATDSAVLYSSIQTFLNTVPLQNASLNVNLGEDYRYLKNTLKGSAVGNQDVFRLFSFWVDNFTCSDHSLNWSSEDKDIGGLPLDKGYQYQVNVNNLVANTVYYVFYVVQKELVIDRSGMSIQ